MSINLSWNIDVQNYFLNTKFHFFWSINLVVGIAFILIWSFDIFFCKNINDSSLNLYNSEDSDYFILWFYDNVTYYRFRFLLMFQNHFVWFYQLTGIESTTYRTFIIFYYKRQILYLAMTKIS